MTQFANTPGIPKEDADKLFAAGVSFLSNKAFSSAYVCFDRIPAKDFKLLYNKALCCFMVEWYDECHRLLCEAERLVPMNAGHGTERLPEAFIHYLHDEERGVTVLPHAARHSRAAGIHTDLAPEGGSRLQTAFVRRTQGHFLPAGREIQTY